MKLLASGLLAALLSTASLAQQDLIYRLPTENDALFRQDYEGFYMYVDRIFEGVTSQAWEGGTFGIVRTPFRASNDEIMYSRLHEGIDIKPMRRDSVGKPLDPVRPIAPGQVVHASSNPGLSNYGRYVVVEHHVPEGRIYSLYAHLASVDCEVGQVVGTGNQLGVLGYSGAGINMRRAHCHLEVCLMINSTYSQFAPKANKHGNFNGLNLIGINAADLLEACKDGEPLSLSRYWSSLQEHYRVRVPCNGPIDLLVRYPFLYKGSWTPCPTSLDIAFTAEGIPVAAYPSAESVSKPTIISCKPMPTLQQNCTAQRVQNSSKTAALTASGRRFIDTILRNPTSMPVSDDEEGATEEEQASD